jgi:putative nucleotidyltransferase with HDIG domain
MDQPDPASGLLDNIQEFATLPTVYSALISILSDPKATTQDVSDAISCDQASAMKVLKVVNSPFFGFPGEIDTISRAVVILGFNEIYHLILTSYLIDFFSKNEEILDFRPVDFWGHSIAVGVATRLIGKNLDLPNPENYFVTGVLHDIGKLIFFEYAEDRFAEVLAFSQKNRVPLAVAEKAVFQTDHSEIGSLLAERWGLPRSIGRAVRYHHSGIVPDEQDPLTAAVHLANILCRALELGYGGDDFIPQPNPKTLEILRTKPEVLKEITPELIKNYEETVRIFI